MDSPAGNSIWPFAVYAGLAVLVAGGMIFVSWLLGERHSGRVRGEPYESGMPPTGSARLRLSVKFYLMAMFFVIFDAASVFIFAWAVAFGALGWAGYVAILVFIGILMVALAYLWRQGALDWGPVRRPRESQQKDSVSHD